MLYQFCSQTQQVKEVLFSNLTEYEIISLVNFFAGFKSKSTVQFKNSYTDFGSDGDYLLSLMKCTICVMNYISDFHISSL